MVTDDVHIVSVVTHKTPKLLKACPALSIIIGTLGSNLRNGVIVCRQFRAQVVGIPYVNDPPIFLLDSHTTMTEGVAEKRYQQHFGGEPNIDWPCLESEPLTD